LPDRNSGGSLSVKAAISSKVQVVIADIPAACCLQESVFVEFIDPPICRSAPQTASTLMKASNDVPSLKRKEILEACSTVLSPLFRKSNVSRLAWLGSQAALAATLVQPAVAAEGSEGSPGIRLEGTDLHIGSAPPISFHGFLSQGFLYSTDYDYLGETTDGSFEFTEIGVNLSVNPFNKTRIAVQGFAFDVGDVGNLVPFLDYASIEYTFNDAFGVRAGRVRRPGGLYNHIQDVDLARTAVLLPQGVYDARWRDFSSSIDGGVLFGNFSLGKAGALSYEAYAGVTNMDKDEGGVAAWITDQAPGSYVSEFDQPLYVGAQLWWNTPLNGLRAGVNVGNMFDFGYQLVVPQGPGPFGPINAFVHGSGDVFFQQYSLEYFWNSWTFQAEFYTFDFDGSNVTDVLSGTTPVAPTTVEASRVNPYAWYVSAAYRFNNWLEVGSYYTQFTADAEDGQTGSPNSFQNDWAMSFRFDPTDWWVLKLEGHLIEGTALLRDEANNPNAERNDDPWFMLALKTTFSF
jgi:hypothetical protein